MAHVKPLDRDELPEFDFIFSGAERALGAVPNSMLTMAHKPGILGAFSLLAGTIFHSMNKGFSSKMLKFMDAFLEDAHRREPENEIPPQLTQLIAHVCSVAAGCRYCQAHTAGSAALLEVPDEKLADVLQYDTSPHYTDAEQAALSLAFAAGKVPNETTPEHFAELRKHYNEEQIVEIVAVISLFGFLNRWNDTMATALEDHPRRFAEACLASVSNWEIGKHAPRVMD